MRWRACYPRKPRCAYEFLVFGLKEAASCVFAGSFLLLLVMSGHISIPGVARYDFLFLGAIAIQLVLIAFRLETWREVAVLSAFHPPSAWGSSCSRPRPASDRGATRSPRSSWRIATVPLYSGFMYAAVASYLMQAWRILDVRCSNAFRPSGSPSALSAAIYANFFTNHYVMDVRWILAATVRRRVLAQPAAVFTVTSSDRRMPLVLAFGLIGFFIWIAENFATFFGAWVYPNQAQKWAIVGPAKISSWALLVIISFIIVAVLKQIFPQAAAAAAAATGSFS